MEKSSKENTFFDKALKNGSLLLGQHQNFFDALNEAVEQYKEEQQTYTYDELIAMFGVIVEFEEALATVKKSATEQSIQVALPPKEAIYEEALMFGFEKATTVPLMLSIYHQKADQIVLHQTIHENTTNFKLILPDAQPGRYYWKIKAATKDFRLSRQIGIFWGIFFIRKDLMPSNL